MLSKSLPNSSNYKSFSLQQSKQHSSNFPWSQKKLHTFNPFPRYNHSASEFDHNDSIIIFGGIVGEKTTNEVYVVEANGFNVLPILAYGDIPKPRSLHSQISFATHMIVFGGIVDDPKENNLDEHIYIFDIVSKHWLKQIICNFNIDGEFSTINSSSSNGSIGRFGHTATVVDTTLYVFGGKNKNNEYLNDFLTFDLKALKLLTKKKSKFKFSSRFGGCASPNFTQSFWDSLIPPRNAPSPRMKHVSCPYNGKIYMFGGTDEIKCYNDIWCYDVKTNQWDELECSGYTPQAREGHGATIMNDVIYIFGGRSEEGEVLGDLAAFRITNKRWYKFPKLGPSPCPRYGITVSKVKNNILVFGGDSKKDPRPDNEGIVHILDTTKIKFPSGDNTSGKQHNSSDSSSSSVITTKSQKMSSSNIMKSSSTSSLASTLSTTSSKSSSSISLSSQPIPINNGNCNGTNNKGHQQNQDQQLSQEIISSSSSSPYPKKTKLSPVLEEAILLSSQESILKLSSTNKDVKGKQKVVEYNIDHNINNSCSSSISTGSYYDDDSEQKDEQKDEQYDDEGEQIDDGDEEDKAQQEAQQRQARLQQIQQEAQQEAQQQARLQQAQQEAQRQAQLQQIQQEAQQEAQRQAQLQQIQQEAQQEAQRQAQLQQIQQQAQQHQQAQQQQQRFQRQPPVKSHARKNSFNSNSHQRTTNNNSPVNIINSTNLESIKINNNINNTITNYDNNNNQQSKLPTTLKLSGITKSNTVEIKEHDNYKPHKTYVEYSNTPGKVSFDGKIPNNQSNLTKSLRGNVRNAVIIENNDFNIIDNGIDNSIGNGIDNNENEDQNLVLNNDDNITRTLPLQDSQLHQQHNHQMEKNDSSVEGSGTLSKKSSFEKLREGPPVNNNNIQQRPRGARPLDKKTTFIPIRMNNNNVNNVDVGIIVGSKTEQVFIPESPIIPTHNHHIQQQQQQTILSSSIQSDDNYVLKSTTTTAISSAIAIAAVPITNINNNMITSPLSANTEPIPPRSKLRRSSTSSFNQSPRSPSISSSPTMSPSPLHQNSHTRTISDNNIYYNNLNQQQQQQYQQSRQQYNYNRQQQKNTISKLSSSLPTTSKTLENDEFFRELEKQKQSIIDAKKRENLMKSTKELEFNSCGDGSGEKKIVNVVDDGDNDYLQNVEEIMNNLEVGSDKYKIVDVIVKMKQQLKYYKTNIKLQSQLASQKISESEKSRIDALDEVAYYKAKLQKYENTSAPTALSVVSSAHKNKDTNVHVHDRDQHNEQQQQNLRTIKLQNLQINQLKQVLKEQQMIFDKVQKTLVIANKRADDTEQRLKDSSQEVATLEKEMSSLKLELTNKSRLLDKSLKKSDELERLLIKAQSEGKMLRSLMQEGIGEILNFRLLDDDYDDYDDGGGNNNNNISKNWRNIKIKKLEKELEILKTLQDNNDENDEYDDYFEYDNNNIIIENNIYDNVDDNGDDSVVDDNNNGNQYLLI